MASGSSPGPGSLQQYQVRASSQMREPADDGRGLELVMATYDGLPGLAT